MSSVRHHFRQLVWGVVVDPILLQVVRDGVSKFHLHVAVDCLGHVLDRLCKL